MPPILDAWLNLPIGLRCLTVMLVIYVGLNLVLGPRKAWQVWKRFGHALGDTIARVVLTLFYFTVMPFFALVTRRQRDVLGLRPGTPLWHADEARPASAEEAARQF
jgi:hypothetical protein